jgi:hypothetical protein
MTTYKDSGFHSQRVAKLFIYCMNVLTFILVFLAAAPLNGLGFEIVGEAAKTNMQFIENALDFKSRARKSNCRQNKENPPPPRLPRNFRWKGRYIVPDLIDPATGKRGVEVPFTWEGKDGDIQMIAGGDDYPIYFTNFIYQKFLYTYTYKWPGLQDVFLPPLESCAPLFPFTLEDLNALLATASYVGPEVLLHPRHNVNHFRVPVVTPPPQPPGFHFRLPLLLGDFYVDRKDSSKFWKVLHFGIQNLYTPDLDEWIVLDKLQHCPGEIILPPACFH